MACDCSRVSYIAQVWYQAVAGWDTWEVFLEDATYLRGQKTLNQV